MASLFRDRRIYVLLTGNIFSSVGSGISMIAIPWLLINRHGGSMLFGYVSFAMTLLMFLAAPGIGVVVDRFSRKRLLLFAELFGLSFVLVFSMWGFAAGGFRSWQLIAVFLGGNAYYALHYPAQFAFTQEIFGEEQYRPLASVLEVQNQTSSMLAGAIAGVLIGKVDLTYILWADGLTYLVTFGAFATLPYLRAEGVGKMRATLFSGVVDGFRYLKSRPRLILFFLCSLAPFISVMVGNYLFPVYILKTLRSGPAVFGAYETTYAIGAVLAGATVPLLLSRLGTFRTVVITVAIYTLSMATVAFLPVVGLFIAAQGVMGWGNAGTRVGRNTELMKVVPKPLIGRVNSFFSAYNYAMRLLLIGAFASVIDRVPPSPMLMFLGLLLVAALVGVLASRSLFRAPAGAPSNVA